MCYCDIDGDVTPLPRQPTDHLVRRSPCIGPTQASPYHRPGPTLEKHLLQDKVENTQGNQVRTSKRPSHRPVGEETKKKKTISKKDMGKEAGSDKMEWETAGSTTLAITMGLPTRRIRLISCQCSNIHLRTPTIPTITVKTIQHISKMHPRSYRSHTGPAARKGNQQVKDLMMPPTTLHRPRICT